MVRRASVRRLDSTTTKKTGAIEIPTSNLMPPPHLFVRCSHSYPLDGSQPAPAPTATEEPDTATVTSAPAMPNETPAPVMSTPAAPETTAAPVAPEGTAAPDTPEDTAAPAGDGSGYVHLGCFKDTKADRVLSKRLFSDDMTTQVIHVTELVYRC